MSFIISVVGAAVLLSQPAEIYVLRHGETTWNVQSRVQGQSNESELTDKGREQVVEVIKRLSPHLRDNQVEIWSSDLVRAHHTAKIVADLLNLSEEKIHLDPSLREAYFGDFEGAFVADFESHPHFLHFLEDQFHHAIDPVKGESYQQVAERVQKAIFRIIEQSDGKTVLIITHGGAMRSLQMKDLPSENDPSQYDAVPNPKHDEIYIFDKASSSLYKAAF